ncbi:MAG: poly-gamma-glutamate system protein [Bacteroidetes bacterium]|nr:poly-gamma-glutamate system protein [Bacteroidota bacterium]
MKRLSSKRLFLLFSLSLTLVYFSERYFAHTAPHSKINQMRSAVLLTEKWFNLIIEEKKKREIPLFQINFLPYEGLIGDEYSEITTTLGSLEAKEISHNSQFAALMVRLISDAGIDSAGSVAIAVSGSFPSLTIATLAACQTLQCHVTLMSSLGASSFGANQPMMTWLDMENILQQQGGLRSRSLLITRGAEGDSGGGLPEEGIIALQKAVERNNQKLWIPKSLIESIEKRMDTLQEKKTELLINIGGSQPMLGGCVHGSTLPNGFHRTLQTCSDDDKGVLVRASELGIPVIHLLNINSLALKYRIINGKEEPEEIYGIKTYNKWFAVFTIVLIFFMFYKKR